MRRDLRTAANRAGAALVVVRRTATLVMLALCASLELAFAAPVELPPVWTFETKEVPTLPCMTDADKRELKLYLGRINALENEINTKLEKASKSTGEARDSLMSQANSAFRRQTFFINRYNALLKTIFERDCPKKAALPPIQFPLIFPLPGGLGLIAGAPGQAQTTVGLYAGANMGIGFTSNDYDHARFDGAGPGIGGQLGARLSLPSGWMVGAEVGGTALAVTAGHSEGPFVDMNWQIWEMAQIGFNTQAFGAPVTLYAGVGATQARFVAGVESGVFRDAMRDTLNGFIARGAFEYGVLPGVSMGFAYQYSRFDGRVEHEPVKTDMHAVMFTANFALGRAHFAASGQR